MAQVVPALATFAVDDGFSYAVPAELAGDIEIGAIVRVPLGGRRVRGYVTSVRQAQEQRLKPVAARSGELAVFTPGLAETLRWAAIHYVAPQAVLLAKAAPPNLARRPAPTDLDPVSPLPPSRSPTLTEAAAAGRRAGPMFLLAGDEPAADTAGLCGPVVTDGGSALVVAATVREVDDLAAGLVSWFGNRVIAAYSDLGAAALTTAWARAATEPGLVVVGTRETALWPVAGLRLAMVMGESRPGMRDRQTPTLHARELLRRRAAVERFALALWGRVPSLEAVAAGARLVPVAGRRRAWPLVEIVDRGEEPPGSGVVAARTRAALSAVVRRRQRAFVFCHRRGYAPAMRCASCRTVRRCPECGSRPDPGASCSRCGTVLAGCPSCGGERFQPLGAGVGRVREELAAVLGPGTVGEPGDPAPVWVGSERDLVGLHSLDLAVVVDADGLVLAPNYRAGEHALGVLARVAAVVGRGRGRRAIVQTAIPRHGVIEALARGEATGYLDSELAQRRREGLPPAGELAVLEVGNPPAGIDDDLAGLGGTVQVYGPATAGERHRWLLQGRDLRKAKIELRRLVQAWRDAGARVRVDADPADL